MQTNKSETMDNFWNTESMKIGDKIYKQMIKLRTKQIKTAKFEA